MTAQIPLRNDAMTDQEAQAVSIMAGQVFTPATPISSRELFAGRVEQLRTLLDGYGQIGLHPVIYGERGVGKTSLANIIGPVLQANVPNPPLVCKVNADDKDDFSSLWNKVIDEVDFQETMPAMGFSGNTVTQTTSLRAQCGISSNPRPDEIRRALMFVPNSVFIFDEFDRIPKVEASGFTDLIKMLSDFAVPATVIIVGVSDTVDELVQNHASITRAIVQVPMPRMDREELRSILKTGQDKLSVIFEDDGADRLVHISQGLPHYAHLIALHSVRVSCQRLSRRITLEDVSSGCSHAVQQAKQSITNKYTAATRSAHKDALYAQVLLACSIAATRTDDLGYFQPSHVAGPLAVILARPEVQISTFARHLNELCEPKRGPVLERTGESRNYRFRFKDPLLPPYVVLKGLASRMITQGALSGL